MLKNKEILLATSNKGKIKEFKKIFNNFKIISQEELGIGDAVEDGMSFFENALKKARHASKEAHLFTIADDSGIVVPELNFEPGIYSERYAGKNAFPMSFVNLKSASQFPVQRSSMNIPPTPLARCLCGMKKYSSAQDFSLAYKLAP